MVFGVPIKVFSSPALASLNCLSATHSSTSINYLQAFSPSLLLIFKAEDSALCTGCVVTGAQVSIAPTFTPSLHLSPTSHQLFNLCVYYYYHYPQLNLNLVLSRTATTTYWNLDGFYEIKRSRCSSPHFFNVSMALRHSRVGFKQDLGLMKPHAFSAMLYYRHASSSHVLINQMP